MAYEINININNGDVEGTQVAGLSKSGTDSVDKYKKQLGKYIASQTIQPFIQEVKTQVSSAIGTYTGRTELQQQVNFGISVVQAGVNAYKNAQGGAVIATGLGLSSGAGIAIGLALSAIETSMNILFNQLEIQRKGMLEALDIQKSISRQGAAYNRSRSN